MTWMLIAYMGIKIGRAGHGGPIAIEFKTKEECISADNILRKNFSNYYRSSVCLGKRQ
jgi:hypothetical protein